MLQVVWDKVGDGRWTLMVVESLLEAGADTK
jgi:hypothetical protein